MLRKMKNTVVPAALVALILAGCGSDGSTQSSADPAPSSSPTESVDGSDAEANGNQFINPDAPMPEVSGSFGVDAALSFPSEDPSAELVVEVLIEGDGPELAAGDLFSSHYLGQVWGGEIFDQSFSHGTPLTIGLGSLVQGWQQGLPGLKMGSRVLLSIPPHLGYPGGNAQAGIGAEDTLVFVVDLLEVIPNQGEADATVTPEAANINLTVTGELGGPAELAIPEDAQLPTELTTTVLATGSGPVVEQAFYAQYVLVSWDGSIVESSWASNFGPQQFHIMHPYFVGVAGIPAGSRVLIEVPASDEDPTGWALVVDITYVPEN